MNDEAVQADEEDLLSYEVSDEALEVAAGNGALPTATFICSGFAARVEQPTHSPAFTANIAKLPELLQRPCLRIGG